LEFKLKENFEEYLWIWLSSNKHFDFTLSLASVDTLKEQQFSQSDLVDFDLENVVKVGLAILNVLLLEANLSVIVELASEQQVVCWLNLDVVDRT
jgi:hypothetical protein